MKIDNRVMSLLALTSGAAAATSLINRYIRFSAVTKKLLTELHPLCFKWRFGNIYFTKTGSGKPLLLIHDFHFASSGCEWSPIIGELKKTLHRLYDRSAGVRPFRKTKPDLHKLSVRPAHLRFYQI